ncbi:coronin-2B [Trichomycterus rosablanca]|uniref:coronin-2B n=1 Tax=Trichomycterus rosablanca TaxID=2290929 RepID=UPI002F360C04
MSWQPPYRSSKFGNVYGKALKNRSYDGVQITRGLQENHCCSVNPRFIAVVTECAGGGAFIVIPVHQTGRVDPHHPRVCGHSAPVLDVQWDPFDDQRIASCSEDCTVKVWEIPTDGLKENMTNPRKELWGHARRVGLIQWHPTAKDVLISSAYDYRVCVWRVDGECVLVRTPVCVIRTHTDLVTGLSFSEDGSALATACRDRRVRVLDPRTGHTLQERSTDCSRVSKVLYLTDLNLLLTTGTSKWNQRHFMLWDPEDLSEPLVEEEVDGGSGVLFPFYDPDTHLIYLAGKGDGNIRYYEASAEKPYLHFLTEYRSPLPHRGLGVMPKRGLDTAACELFRFYRLLTSRDAVEPLSFIVPRKCGYFREDIYPRTASMTAQEWLRGQNKGPVLMSPRPETKIQNPYPAPEQGPGYERPASNHKLQEHTGPGGYTLQEDSTNRSTGGDAADLSEWQEDETQLSGRCGGHAGVRWWESGPYTPPAAEKELINTFYRQQEEIRSLRQQLDQRDRTIQHLELEIKNIRNRLRASF